MQNCLTRRQFFQSLAALAVVAAVPLPVGLPQPIIIGIDVGSKSDYWVVAIARSIRGTREIMAVMAYNNAFAE